MSTTKPPDIDLGQYKFGWHDPAHYVFEPKKGLNPDVVREISFLKGEPEWMTKFRLRALEIFEREAQQVCAQQRPRLQIEGTQRLFTNQTVSRFFSCCFRQTGEVFDDHCEAFSLADDLNRLSVQIAEGRAQCFMPPD